MYQEVLDGPSQYHLHPARHRVEGTKGAVFAHLAEVCACDISASNGKRAATGGHHLTPLCMASPVVCDIVLDRDLDAAGRDPRDGGRSVCSTHHGGGTGGVAACNVSGLEVHNRQVRHASNTAFPLAREVS